LSPLRQAVLNVSHKYLANETAALVKQHIGREFVNAEKALDSVVCDLLERLQTVDSPRFREREHIVEACEDYVG
jgi:hypothetical protein